MKAKFAKVLALVMMLALVLSGCNLIEIDAKMQADEDIAKIDERYGKVVAGYDGGEITAGEIMADFNSYYNEMAYMYYYYLGSEISAEETTAIMQEVMAERVRTEIAAAKFDESNALSDEEIAAAEAEAQAVYDENFAGALESAQGERDDQKQEYARVIMAEYGLDLETLQENTLLAAKAQRMEEILRAEVAEVSDAELQAAFDERVAQQQSSYTDGYSFENAMSSEGEIVCWMPEGYRSVKHILVMPDETTKTAYNSAVSNLETAKADLETLNAELIAANDGELAEGERSAAEIQAEIDAINATMGEKEMAVSTAEQICLMAVSETTDEIYARLQNGESFDSLIAEYGEDPGMQSEPTMSRGYCVSEASINWEVNFRDAAMALANVGDYTARPVVSGSGVHIIQYTADVPAGEVDIETVREALSAETLTALADEHVESTISAWMEAAKPSYDVVGFDAVFSAE